jgi:hypothetical protein
MALKRWFEKTERKDAKGLAKEKGCFAWQYVSRVKKRGEDKPVKREGIYVGMNLPAVLRKENTQAKLIHEPKR